LPFCTSGRDILSTFAMAVFLFLIIEGFATAIDNASKAIGMRAARLISILLVTGGFVAFIALMANGVPEFGRHAEDYESKINAA
jgi:AI-2 transport protein TqsA